LAEILAVKEELFEGSVHKEEKCTIFESTHARKENIDFEEKVDIDDLVLPSKMEFLDVKKEPSLV
jgi:hypothetical protein